MDDEPSRRERFEAAILVHLDAAYNLARWLLREDAAAHDAVQDAALRAFRHFDGMLGPTPKAWFMAIVRRACLDWIEHEKRRHGLEQSHDDDNEAHAMPTLDADGAPESPESLAIRAADLRQLHACLAALPREFREVLILRELEELSYREISSVVGIPIGTVMSRLARGRDRLARQMQAAQTAARIFIVNCEHVHKVLDAHLDGELDEATDAQLMQHLAGCEACAHRVAEREALRGALRQLPRHAAPAFLRRDIRLALDDDSLRVPAPERAGRGAWWWRATGLAGLAAALAFVAGLWVGTPHPADLREEVLQRHVSSLAPGGQRVEVASLDRHTVKPWFAGKLDFAPPVRDLSAQGFVLEGGRVDQLAGRPAAALVYRVRQHEINLFVSRAAAQAGDAPPTPSALRGFSILSWRRGGLAFDAISDVEPGELQRFGALMLAPEG